MALQLATCFQNDESGVFYLLRIDFQMIFQLLHEKKRQS